MSGGRKGFVEADTVREAKRKATEASGTRNWKKTWRLDSLGHFVKYNGDARLSPIYHGGNHATLLCILRECPE